MRIKAVTPILLIFLFSTPVLGSDEIRMPCEILEVSPNFQTDSSVLRQIRYILLHHANAADRETLSKWLKNKSGDQILFIFGGREYLGILCRLPHCFGRGLLLYSAPIKLKARDIIEVILPTSSKGALKSGGVYSSP